MALYKGTKDLQPEIATKLLNDGDFMTENIWRYSEAIPESFSKLLKEVSVLTLLDMLCYVQNYRKKALKFYYKEQERIKRVIYSVDSDSFPWFKNERSSLYEQSEQVALRELLLFVITSKDDDKEIAKQIMNQVIPEARGVYSSEKEYRKMRREIIDSVDESRLKDMDLNVRLMHSLYLNKGFLNPLTEDVSDAAFWNHYYTTMMYVFSNEYVEKFEFYHLLIMQPAIFRQVALWALEGNQYYLFEHHKDILEALSKEEDREGYEEIARVASGIIKDNTAEKSKGWKKEFKIGDIEFPIHKGDSIFNFLDNASKRLSMMAEGVLMSSVAKFAISVKNRRAVLSQGGGDVSIILGGEPTNVMSDEEKEEYESTLSQAQYYRGIEATIKRVSWRLMGYAITNKGVIADIIRQPITKEIWNDIDFLFSMFSHEKDQIVNYYRGEFQWCLDSWAEAECLAREYGCDIPEDEEERMADDYLIPNEAFLSLEVNSFVYAALTALFANLDTLKKEASKGSNKKKQDKAIAKKEESKLTKENEKLTKEIQLLKKQLAEKEQLLSKKNVEIKKMADSNRKMSKENSRMSSLEQKLQVSQDKVEELQRELEEQQPIIIERKTSSVEVEPSETLRRLNHEDETVVMVGGHQALIARMKQWIPDIDCIESRDYTREISSRATIVILNVSYINHPMYYKAVDRIETIRRNHDVKVVYLNSQLTNQEVLLREIGKQL